jgi:hypothetical protein
MTNPNIVKKDSAYQISNTQFIDNFEGPGAINVTSRACPLMAHWFNGAPVAVNAVIVRANLYQLS